MRRLLLSSATLARTVASPGRPWLAVGNLAGQRLLLPPPLLRAVVAPKLGGSRNFSSRKHKGIGRKLPKEVLMVEGALSAGDDKVVLKMFGKLSDDEKLVLLKDLYRRQITEDGFMRMDKDHDGKITEEEYSQYMKEINDNQFRKPTGRQLGFVMVASGVPFIGFGFMDNVLMIVFGETIEMNLGLALGFSTMACAALGNTFSDVIGVGMAGYIELLAKRLGVKDPLLTSSQLRLASVRIASSSGSALGITFGCIIGMFPLLFINNSQDEGGRGSGSDQSIA